MLNGNSNPAQVVARSGPAGAKGFCHRRRGAIILALVAALFSANASAQKAPPPKPAAPLLGVQIVSNGDEPELRVGGVPYFIHAAQFDYFRIPPDLWSPSLSRYRELGINTIDLRIPWNWHEPSDGEFDFDGHTNPRRNLRGVLQLIARMRLKLIVRPGPLIGDQWRNQGFPAWLLVHSDYKMSAADIEKGLAPQEAGPAAHDSNEAARTWLASETHMTYTRRWLTAVAKELAPYAARRPITITEAGDREGETQDTVIAGPILFVALDNALMIYPGSEAADLSRYLAELRGALRRGGLNAISFVNAPDVAVQGASSFPIGLSPEGLTQTGLAGEWFFQPSVAPAAAPGSSGSPASPQSSLLTIADASSLVFLANSLGTQPNFPPFLSGFAATTFAPAGELRANQPPPENMLLASRLLLGSGVRAFVYSPLQDTLTPAGWETPVAARYFRWDAALDLAANRGPRANSVARNGQFISSWGAMLASSHTRADFGIVDLRTCAAAADAAANSRNARAMEQLFRAAGLAGFAPELVNPAEQSVERLLRDPAILLPVPRENAGDLQLTEKAQVALVEFVRRGGILIYFPSRPQGTQLERLWRGASGSPPTDANFNEWGFERGQVIASSDDFDSRGSLADDLGQNRAEPESSAAIEALAGLLGRAGIFPALRRTGSGQAGANLFVTQLVSNAIPSPADRPCVEGQLCAAALVSVTNVSSDQSASESFEMIDPRPAGTRGVPPKISFDVTVPARESLLLPIHAPLCSAASPGEHCSDEVIAAGAELLGAEREGKNLELTFYAPARAVVRLKLESAPSKVELDPDIRLDDQWKQETGELEVSLLRGAAPDYRRVLLVHLRYTPHVVEKPDPAKSGHVASEYEVFDALRFPLAADATIPTSPPLVVGNPGSGGSTLIASTNHSDNLRTADFDLAGAFHGTGSARMFGNEQVFTRLRFQPNHNSGSGDASATPVSDGLLHGILSIRSGREHGDGPVLFVPENETGNIRYQYDFERDGALEWVLESNRLRMIVSPANGGRALALVDKSTNDDLITLDGALHDFLVPAGTAPAGAPALGDFSFNHAYRAGWVEDKQDASLRLTYRQFENSAAGIHVEKTLRLAAPETIETSYRVSSVASVFSAPPRDAGTEQSFISMLSVPVPVNEEGNLHFCWQSSGSSARSPAPTEASAPTKSPGPLDSHCEDFVPSGAPIPVPDDITRIEIASPGRATLEVEWTSGQLTIVPKAFSAELHLVVPVPVSTDAPAEFTLRYTVESGP